MRPPVEPLAVSLQAARRLVVTKQHLAGSLGNRFRPQMLLDVVRDLDYVQWDPIAIVAPSHLLSMHARLGKFRPADLERALWVDKTVFEHWTPLASIVLAEDYPLFASLMRRYPESLSRSWGSQRIRAKQFLRRHRELRRRVLQQLRRGPLTLGQFEDHLRTKRRDGVWTYGSDVSLMLFQLTLTGDVMVVGHEGTQNLWGLADRFLPESVDRRPVSAEEFERRAAERAVKALGTATPREITLYFVRGRYEHPDRALRRLEDDSSIRRVTVEGGKRAEGRYVHRVDVPLLSTVQSSEWVPRTSLLPPFDNLIFSQDRTIRLFDFDYVREQFLPKEKRRYGTYVLPILRGENLIGRVDPRLDRDGDRLIVNAVHAEPAAPRDREAAADVAASVERLAKFLGVADVEYSANVPVGWRRELR